MDADTARQTVLAWLCADGRQPAECSQSEYQQVAWYTVPHEGGGPRADVAEACAEFLEETGRPRAAAAMRRHSPSVLAAWERSASAGFRAFVKANDATGVTAPDTPQLAWAAVFGGDEAAVLDAAERVLERAVEDGRLVPGDRGWRDVQRGILEHWLTTPQPELGGAVPVDAVRAERQEWWLTSGTRARAGALRPALNAILNVIEPAPDPPAPLQALLDATVEPITLTAAHRVPPRIVGEVAERSGWAAPGTTHGRSEAHTPAFVALREIAADARLLARRGRTVRLTPTGRAAQADPALLADLTATAWFGDDDFVAAVAEIAAAVLLHGPASVEKIVDVAAAAVAPSWCAPDGSRPDRAELRTTAHEWLRRGLALGWLQEHPAGYALTGAGQRAASAGLRRRAHGPRSHP